MWKAHAVARFACVESPSTPISVISILAGWSPSLHAEMIWPSGIPFIDFQGNVVEIHPDAVWSIAMHLMAPSSSRIIIPESPSIASLDS